MAEGVIFNTITNGKNTMASYGDKLTAEDRWAVILYVRALERARQGTAADVPAEHKADLGL
jgi:mono/diheme cytochrome c family protein